MDSFTIRGLRERTGELVRDAESVKLSLITKHGQPVFVAVPFDETLIREGVKVALAVKLFDSEVYESGQGGKISGHVAKRIYRSPKCAKNFCRSI